MDWIDKAFQEAKESAKESEAAIKITEDFICRYSGELIDQIALVIPQKVMVRVATAMTMDEEVSEAFRTICGSFMLNGFLMGQRYERQSEENN